MVASVVAWAHGVALLVVHHTRKSGADDFVDVVSGTHGLAGAADSILVLRRARGQHDAVLAVTGRDIDEVEHPLQFAPDLGAWQLLDGPAIDYEVSDTRRAILRHVREHEGTTPKSLADTLGIEHNTAKQRLWQMARADQLDTDGSGYYFTPSVTHNPHNRVTDDQANGYCGWSVTRFSGHLF